MVTKSFKTFRALNNRNVIISNFSKAYHVVIGVIPISYCVVVAVRANVNAARICAVIFYFVFWVKVDNSAHVSPVLKILCTHNPEKGIIPHFPSDLREYACTHNTRYSYVFCLHLNRARLAFCQQVDCHTLPQAQ